MLMVRNHNRYLLAVAFVILEAIFCVFRGEDYNLSGC